MSEAAARAPRGATPYEGLTVALSVEADAWSSAGLGEIEAFAHATFAAVAEHLAWPSDTVTEIAVTLADDATVRAVNAEWRGKDRPTNILSFPMPAAGGSVAGPLFGDCLLAYETVAREAGDEGKRFADHLRHLLVHGFLHLAGFDHESEAEAEAMEAREIAILAQFGIHDPYKERVAVEDRIGRG